MITRRGLMLALPALGIPGARQGLLPAGALAFPEALLFAGLPFGMGAGELRAWLRSAPGRRIWEDGWAGAGFRAFPCALLQNFAWKGTALPFGFGQVVELAVPEQHWRQMPQAARRAIQADCEEGMVRTITLSAPGSTLTPVDSAALAEETAARLRQHVPATARRAYAEARRHGFT